MPPFSRTIDDEGLRLRNWPLLRGGVLNTQGWHELLRGERQPPAPQKSFGRTCRLR